MKRKVYYFICYVCKRRLPQDKEHEAFFMPGACVECYHKREVAA